MLCAGTGQTLAHANQPSGSTLLNNPVGQGPHFKFQTQKRKREREKRNNMCVRIVQCTM